ncbi:MAG: hypothetical protein KatS3mg103_1435 [Phycisphaerales bacterium]|nr:MAG: hypothetical protein KatS3mg103_1435 [Phycisphaerales bacterium]
MRRSLGEAGSLSMASSCSRAPLGVALPDVKLGLLVAQVRRHGPARSGQLVHELANQRLGLVGQARLFHAAGLVDAQGHVAGHQLQGLLAVLQGLLGVGQPALQPAQGRVGAGVGALAQGLAGVVADLLDLAGAFGDGRQVQVQLRITGQLLQGRQRQVVGLLELAALEGLLDRSDDPLPALELLRADPGACGSCHRGHGRGIGPGRTPNARLGPRVQAPAGWTPLRAPVSMPLVRARCSMRSISLSTPTMRPSLTTMAACWRRRCRTAPRRVPRAG